MLARLQQFITLGLLMGSLAWLAACLQRGQPGLAIGGVLLIAGGHAWVLGLEFILLARVHGDDPTPRATTAQLLRAWWGEVLSAPLVFCWRQPFFSRRFPDHLPPDAAGRRGLLLVHGFVCNRGLWNGWYPRLRATAVPCVGVSLEPVFGAIDSYVPALEQAVRQLEQATGVPPVIVAHSMGGLAVRRWWAEQPAGRIHHLVTIGSPHQGTWLAHLAFSTNGRQMRIGSRWLQALAARESAEHRRRTTCFYSHCDNIVFPPSRATLAGADNRHIVGTAHVHLAQHAEPFDEVMRRLHEPAAVLSAA